MMMMAHWHRILLVQEMTVREAVGWGMESIRVRHEDSAVPLL